jgi:hypothetical protein
MRKLNLTTWVGMLLWSSVGRAQANDLEHALIFRDSVGLGAADVAATGVSPPLHADLLATVEDHLTGEGSSGAPIVNEVALADQEVMLALSSGRSADEPRDALVAARATLIESLEPLIAECQALLAADGGLVDRAIENAGLDSPYRLLELSDGQWQALLELQHKRDAVLLDARQWHRPGRLEAARQGFEAAARAVLTAEQQAELEHFQANIAANLEAVLDREAAWDSSTPEPGESDTVHRGKALPEWAARLLAAAKRLTAEIRAALQSPADDVLASRR